MCSYSCHRYRAHFQARSSGYRIPETLAVVGEDTGQGMQRQGEKEPVRICDTTRRIEPDDVGIMTRSMSNAKFTEWNSLFGPLWECFIIEKCDVVRHHNSWTTETCSLATSLRSFPSSWSRRTQGRDHLYIQCIGRPFKLVWFCRELAHVRAHPIQKIQTLHMKVCPFQHGIAIHRC